MKKLPALTTQEKILEAAKKVFHRKGFEGARMQEIADEAGINKALLHYYFRNKETLFEAVFEDAFSTMFTSVFSLISKEVPFEEKIRELSVLYITFLQENSYIPWFIINGLYERPEKFGELFRRKNIQPMKVVERFRVQILEEYGVDIDPRHFFLNFLSLCIFPVVARPLLQQVFNISNAGMTRFTEERKMEVPAFILHAVRGMEAGRPQKKR